MYSVTKNLLQLEKLTLEKSILLYTVGGKIIWSPADFVRLPTDKEMISL